MANTEVATRYISPSEKEHEVAQSIIRSGGGIAEAKARAQSAAESLGRIGSMGGLRISAEEKLREALVDLSPQSQSKILEDAGRLYDFNNGTRIYVPPLSEEQQAVFEEAKHFTLPKQLILFED